MNRPARPDLAGLVLAAGAGSRLRPLTDRRPKPLCPVGNVALLDLALDRAVAGLGRTAVEPERASWVAVNLCHGRAAIEAHLDASPRGAAVHRSIEAEALGTAGAVGALRGWLDGRGVLILNGDTWCPAPLDGLVDGWDGATLTVAVSGQPPLHARAGIVASILPWSIARRIEARPAGLWELVWREALAEGTLRSVGVDGPFVDCGTPAQYLAANLAALELAGTDRLVAAGARLGPGAVLDAAVVGEGARVDGVVRRSVLWPGATVTAGEELVEVIRTDDGLTLAV
ncbi:MAG: NDP-sugar synthase [Acidimicrobiia bacterium]